MKFESKPERAEQAVYRMLDFTKGVYEKHLEPYPIMQFMFCGLLGGVAVAKMMDKD